MMKVPMQKWILVTKEIELGKALASLFELDGYKVELYSEVLNVLENINRIEPSVILFTTMFSG